MCVDNLTFNFICVIIPEVEVVVPNTGPPQQERVVCYNTLIYIHIQCELIEILYYIFVRRYVNQIEKLMAAKAA